MSMEDAATALHLLRDVLELGDGTVSAIHIGCVRFVIRNLQKNLGHPAPRQPKQRHRTPTHGENGRKLHGNNRRSETLAYNDLLLFLRLATRRSLGH